MVKQEVTNTRDLLINNWRRQEFFPGCYMTDVDALEYRYEGNKIKFVAVIDYKQWQVIDKQYINSSSIYANYELAKKLEVPFFVVWYRMFENELQVKLWNVTENPDFENYFLYVRHYTEEKFISLINNLGK